jgi:hypothetical protein
MKQTNLVFSDVEPPLAPINGGSGEGV